MSVVDWIVMTGFIAFVVIYGVIKTRGTKDIDSYIRAGRKTPWLTITLSIMATQASGITFLSTPGQAYVDGMRFVQIYLGLPIAMIILSITAVPLYNKLNVYTAYEYLEKRFDLKNRTLSSLLFLSQRGLAAGFTIYAPALILSVILGWQLDITIILIGIAVILYTTVGGTNAVNKTHIFQMVIITAGMFSSFIVIYYLLPDDISIIDAAYVAGKLGKLNAIDFTFDLSNRYTIWSGLIGGTFLSLSYFGTDQSQVQRYLAGSSVKDSRMGLLVNGLVKLPMQFIILFIGAMVFVFYQFITPPMFFNPVEEQNIKNSIYSSEYFELEQEYKKINSEKQTEIREMLVAIENDKETEISKEVNDVLGKNDEAVKVREDAISLIKDVNPDADTSDANFIFITFIINFLPVGLVGLVLAAALSASMSSTSAELNALASTTVIDIYKRMIRKDEKDEHYLKISKLSTVLWGIYAIIFALFASELGSLVEAVNILGSLVYGTILGIFLVAFYLKKISGNATFYSALIAEIVVLYCYLFTSIPFLWYNVIGCLLVIIVARVLTLFLPNAVNT
ncbi:MAG: sodium:solute symporter [Ignavibacteriaceae bacterium]